MLGKKSHISLHLSDYDLVKSFNYVTNINDFANIAYFIGYT